MRIPSLSPTRRKHAGHQIFTFISILVQIIVFTVVRAVDFVFPSQQISELAFGSCHKAKSRKKQHLPHTHKNAFRNIPKHIPVWLWTGDAIYPPMRGIAPVELLRREYDNMKANATLGYGEFIRNKIVLGTWDDHDYGANDMGNQMPDRHDRAAAYWHFLGRNLSTDATRPRDGVYSSATFGIPPRQVMVISLDTRWHREDYCLPSVATKLPMGAAIACALRWLSAGLFDSVCPKNRSMLGAKQWNWLESELRNSKAAVHVIVSSVQVLTTNPAMESWGHFPDERRRLVKLLSNISGAVLLSGDVHHGEILDPRAGIDNITTRSSPAFNDQRLEHTHRSSFLEVTSSGLTHICSQQGKYGALCEPLLNLFHKHRYLMKDNYYIQPNFGTLHVDWDAMSLRVNVNSVDSGDIVLTTGERFFDPLAWTEDEFDQVLPCMDGHLMPLATSVVAMGTTIILAFYVTKRRRET